MDDQELLLSVVDQIAKQVARGNAAGCRLLEGKPCPHLREKPRYYKNSRELWADGTLLYPFEPQAHNVIAVLTAFQKRRWRHEIPDPLCKAGGQNDPKRLENAARVLNSVQKSIVFSTTASARKIRWDYRPMEETEESLPVPRT